MLDIAYVVLPRLAAHAVPGALWRVPVGRGAGRPLFLTYDDGPSPDTTPILLSLLGEHDARATFFMSGERMERHPDLVHDVAAAGHRVALHGYSHIDAWRHPADAVIGDFHQGAAVMRMMRGDDHLLFRPPYGHLRPTVMRAVAHAGGQTVMWDLLAGDFAPGATAASVVARVMRHAQPGSIIVLHDGPGSGLAIDATKQLLELMPARGYSFRSLHPDPPPA